MGLKRKLEGEIEITSAASEVFHDMLKNTPNDFSIVSPHSLQGCDLHLGDFGTPGSTVIWKYTLDGKARTAKDIVEVIDEEKKLIKFKTVEGDRLKEYKNFSVTFQATPKDEKTSIIKWILEYEKLNSSIPEPSAFMDYLLGLIKDITDHHDSRTKAQN